MVSYSAASCASAPTPLAPSGWCRVRIVPHRGAGGCHTGCSWRSFPGRPGTGALRDGAGLWRRRRGWILGRGSWRRRGTRGSSPANARSHARYRQSSPGHGDRGSSLRPRASDGEGSIIVRSGDVPAVAVLHPRPPEGQATVVVAGDDEFAAGDFVPVVQQYSFGGDVASEDPVRAGTRVELEDGVEGLRDQHRRFACGLVCAPSLIGGLEDGFVGAGLDAVVAEIGVDDVGVSDPQSERGLLSQSLRNLRTSSSSGASPRSRTSIPNAPPASTAASCAQSPTSNTFAPTSVAWVVMASRARVPAREASSMMTSWPAVRFQFPRRCSWSHFAVFSVLIPRS